MKTKNDEDIIRHPIVLRRPHPTQKEIWESSARRKIIRAGRRGGKTVIAATICVDKFLQGYRPLYAAPTSDQLETWWFEVKRALYEPIEAGALKKNESTHSVEQEGTKNRIRGKTAWNADSLRGDYADYLVLDEYQLMNEDTWEVVGAPMLLDNDGDAMFIYTPPSLHSRSVTKARDPMHAAKLFKKAKEDTSGRWAAFHFASQENPHISVKALGEITQDMSSISYRQEILAEDINEAPGALWTQKLIDSTRLMTHPTLVRVVVGVDPTGSTTNECGIVVAGKDDKGEGHLIDDRSLLGTPGQWADEVINAYVNNNADIIVGEANFGGDMVEATIMQAAKARKVLCRYRNVHASRGKAIRAEPIVAAYEHGKAHNIGNFPHLESEMVMWIPGTSKYSPNRLDALVWAMTELDLNACSAAAPANMMTAHSRGDMPGYAGAKMPHF
jgi:hypothetical protein